MRAPPPAADDLPIPDRICSLLRHFYTLGWCTASGGGISIADRAAGAVYVAPSGAQKERVAPADVFKLSGDCAAVLAAPAGLRQSECTPLFAAAYALATPPPGAVIHSHALEALVVTRLFADEFRTGQSGAFEMKKGLPGHGNVGDVVVPIVENTEREAALVGAVRAAILAYPRARAVLVRNHGCYVWGRDWGEAKTTAEALHYLFAAVERLHIAGVARLPEAGFWRGGSGGRVAMRAWLMPVAVDDGGGGGADIRAANRDPVDDWLVPLAELEALGVAHTRFGCEEDCALLAAWRKERGYDYADTVCVSAEAMGDGYERAVETFKKEHFHDAAEVRAILEGSGACLLPWSAQLAMTEAAHAGVLTGGRCAFALSPPRRVL
jgi:methylthioribulose-1-phosphate dehydratase